MHDRIVTVSDAFTSREMKKEDVLAGSSRGECAQDVCNGCFLCLPVIQLMRFLSLVRGTTKLPRLGCRMDFRRLLQMASMPPTIRVLNNFHCSFLS